MFEMKLEIWLVAVSLHDPQFLPSVSTTQPPPALLGYLRALHPIGMYLSPLKDTMMTAFSPFMREEAHFLTLFVLNIFLMLPFAKDTKLTETEL